MCKVHACLVEDKVEVDACLVEDKVDFLDNFLFQNKLISVPVFQENILSPPKPLSAQSVEDTSKLSTPVLDCSGKPSTSSCSEHTFVFNSPNSSSLKRKSSEVELQTEADLLTKRPCESPSADSTFLSEVAWHEEALRSRWQQEEEDRRLAMRLQKELDRKNSVDRRKGSADGYPLRQKPTPPSTSANPDEEENTRKSISARATARNSAGRSEKTEKRLSGTVGTTPVSSSTTVPPALKKGAKQTTLTEMFPNLSS